MPRIQRDRAPRRAASIGWFVAAVLVGLLVGGAAVALLDGSENGKDPFGGQIQSSTYQAVILSNDKVYFGQLRPVTDDFYQLRRAFFLREARDAPDSEPVRAVVPIRREIHGPENSMLIRTEEVIVIENLDEDSAVLAEIRRHNREDE